MKVLFVTPNFPPEVHAGTEMAVSALGRALRARGVEVAVVSASDEPYDGRDVLREEYQGLRVARLKKRDDEWDQSRLQRPRLLDLVDGLVGEERPDLLHVHSLSVLGTGHAARARARGIATALTFHDLWVTCARAFRLPPAGITCPTDTDRTTCAQCVNLTLQHPDPQFVLTALHARQQAILDEVALAAFLSAPSRTAARTVARFLPTERPVEVVPHGLLATVPADQRARPLAAGERLRIGTFGNLVEQKGVLELVRAVAGIDCELHLGGSFFDAEFARAVRELADAQGVQLVYHGPFGPGTEHPARHLHLAVFPSKCQETYGLVVDEALAHGVPTVVSDLGALAERGATGGVVVSALPRLGSVLHDLAGDRRRLEALRAAVPTALPTIEQAAARFHELYRTTLAAR